MEDEDELLNQTLVVLDRASDGNMYIVPADQRRTVARVTRFEAGALVSMRAKQIDAGQRYFACLDGLPMGHLFASRIAIIEYNQGKCPLMIARPVGTIDSQGHQHYEMWNPNEMEREYINPEAVGE